MFKLITNLFLCTVICIAGFTQEKKHTLRECIEVAIASNTGIKKSELLTGSAAENLKQAKRNRLPDITANINNGFNQGRSIDPFSNSYINQQVGYSNYNLGSGILLYNGSQLKNAVQMNRLTLDAANMELQQQKENLTVAVILAYLQVLSFEEQLKQADNQVTLTGKQLERLEILNSQGAIVPSLFYDLKGQFASDQLTVIDLQNSLDNARLSLLLLMNKPYDKYLVLERITSDQFTADYEAGVEEIFKKALSNLSGVKAAGIRKQVATTAIKIAVGQAYPRIGLNANLNSNFSSVATKDIFINSVDAPTGDFVNVNGNKVPVFTQRNNFSSSKIGYINQLGNNYNTSVSLNLTIPIFNASLTRSRVALAKIDLKNADYIIENNRIQLRQAIEQSWLNMNSAYQRYTLVLQQVNDLNQSFRAADVRFASGVSASVDYLVAKNNLDRANINLVTAKYDYLLRKMILDFYQGNNIY